MWLTVHSGRGSRRRDSANSAERPGHGSACDGSLSTFVSVIVTDVRFSNTLDSAPASAQRRPTRIRPAGIAAADTVTFAGVGLWNGLAGYRFEITASDRGEPGRDHDTFSLKVFAPNGDLVASALGVLQGGNIQSVK